MLLAFALRSDSGSWSPTTAHTDEHTPGFYQLVDTFRITGSSVVVTVWKMRLMLLRSFSFLVVMRSKALS